MQTQDFGYKRYQNNSDDFFEDYKNETKIDGYHLYDMEAPMKKII